MSSQLQQSKIAFIGGGNMAAAIIGGLTAKGIDKQNVTVSEPWDVNRAKMAETGVRTTTSNSDAARDADIVILAVKPQVARGVCEELAGAFAPSSSSSSQPLIISIVAGITAESLGKWLSKSGGGGEANAPHIVRVMPNTPALVGEGASGLFAGSDVTAAEKELAAALLSSVSKATEWVDREELLDVVTGLSGMCDLHVNLRSHHMHAFQTVFSSPPTKIGGKGKGTRKEAS